MGFFDRLMAQFIEIIEWTDDTRDTMVYRFPVYAKEIKNGAKLVVREGQAAVFIREGRLADVMQPGIYTLNTSNLPILSTLLGWKYNFESPFKAEVYFVSTRVFTDLKWGTQNPIMMRDADFGAVRLRAFGSYAIRISDPGRFIKEIVGTDGLFETAEISEFLRDMLIQSFTKALGQSKIPALDLASNYRELGGKLSEDLGADFTSHGLKLERFIISNISLPPEVEAAMDRRTQMGVIGDMQRYTSYQVANSIPDAAKQPGGIAGLGMGFAAGGLMASQMAGQMSNSNAAPQAPYQDNLSGVPNAATNPVYAKLAQLKQLLDAGLIEKSEFDEKKKEMIARM